MRIVIVIIVLALTSCATKKKSENHDAPEIDSLQYYMALGKRYVSPEEHKADLEALAFNDMEIVPDIRNLNVNELLRYEENAGSEPLKRKIHDPRLLPYPLSFQRKKEGVHDLEVIYRFDNDSIMEYAEYWWHQGGDETTVQDEKLALMRATINKYNELEERLNALFGPGKVVGSFDLSYADTEMGMQKKVSWIINHGLEVTLDGVASNYHEKIGPISFDHPHYNVLLRVYALEPTH